MAGPDPPIDLEILRDTQATNDFLANVPMEWPNPGDKSGYMAILVGNYMSSLIQKTTDNAVTAGKFLHDEVCKPLGIEDEFYLGLPSEIPDSRIATIDAKKNLELFFGGCHPDGFMRQIVLQPKSYVSRSFNNPRLSSEPTLMNFDRRQVREVELPGVNVHATSRAIAKIYSAVERAINDPKDENPLGFAPDTLRELQKPAQPSRFTGYYDEILMCECPLSLGFMKPLPDSEKDENPPPKGARVSNFGCDERAFGTSGAGGSLAFCDPESGLAFCYTMNRTGDCLVDDPREFALRTKAYICAQAMRGSDEPSLPLDRLTTPFYLNIPLLDRYPFLQPLPVRQKTVHTFPTVM